MLFKNKAETKITRFELRAESAVRAELQKRADASKLSLAEYLIRCGLGRPIANTESTDIINELRALADMQRELFANSGQHEEAYMEILKTIVFVLKAIPIRLKSRSS